MHTQLAGSGSEEVAFDADDVAEVQLLVKCEVLFTYRIFADINLQPLAVLQQMRESGLAHAANGGDAAGHLHYYARLEFDRGLGSVLRQYLRNGVREIEAVAVRLEAQCLDFRDAADALLVQFVFKGQNSAPGMFGTS